MKLDFDNKTPLLDQRMRVAAAKKPGRKHQIRSCRKEKIPQSAELN